MITRTISTGLFLLYSGLAMGQFEEVEPSKRSTDPSVRAFLFTTRHDNMDTVTIKVINPRGEMQCMPVCKEIFEKGEKASFELLTKNWIPGTYHIIGVGREGRIYTQKLRVKPKI